MGDVRGKKLDVSFVWCKVIDIIPDKSIGQNPQEDNIAGNYQKLFQQLIRAAFKLSASPK